MFDLAGEDVETISSKPLELINETAEGFASDIVFWIFGFVCECVFELFN